MTVITLDPSSDPLPSGFFDGLEIPITDDDAIQHVVPIWEVNELSILVAGDLTHAGVRTFSSQTIDIAKERRDPSAIALNDQFVANIDSTIPGLQVLESNPTDDTERPVFVWHRSNHRNTYSKFLIGQPSDNKYPPYDILLRAPIDHLDDQYVRVLRKGTFTTGPHDGSNFVIVKGAHFRDLPQSGHLRVLNGSESGQNWKYFNKAPFWGPDADAIILIGDSVTSFPISDPSTTLTNDDQPGITQICQVLHQEYSAPCVRLEFSVNETVGSESVQVQFKVGTLDMAAAYELNDSEADDNLVRGLAAGYAVSDIHTQNGFITDSESPTASPEGFICYKGGFKTGAGSTDQLWNVLEIMHRDDQVWIWWNGLLVPPDTAASAALADPVAISTPYFTVEDASEMGKVGMRLWPGTKVRSVDVHNQIIPFSEFTYGQVEIST